MATAKATKNELLERGARMEKDRATEIAAEIATLVAETRQQMQLVTPAP
jgi:hypothetical protein